MMDSGDPLRLAVLVFLGILYFLIGVFRSAYGELNPMSSARILASRGMAPREGESAGETLPVMRVTFDLAHHVVLIVAAAVCFYYFRDTSPERAFLLGGGILVAAVVVLQLGARLLALADPERAFSASLVVLVFLYRAISPLVAPGSLLIRRIRRAGRKRRLAAPDEEAAGEEIEAFIDAGQKDGILEQEEGELMRQVVEFHDSVVREVMTPRMEIIALPITATIAQARDLIARERHSRIPVYRERIDDVQGIITLKDLVAGWGKVPEDSPVTELMRPALFVPETRRVSALMKELQARRLQMAVVVDEYGGTAGVVTIEDLLEELVGEIQEEHEREEASLVQESEGNFVARGSASVDDLEGALGVELEAEGFDTIAGLIYSIIGRIPAAGEVLEHNGLRLEVLKADTRRIRRVRVSRLEESKTK